MHATRLFACCLLAGSLLPASAQNQLTNKDQSQPDSHGITLANMDKSVKPGDNFFEYCNGEWLKRTEIQPDRAGVNVFTKLSDLSNQRTASLIEELAHGSAAPGSGQRKVADLYNSYMDEPGIEAKKTEPLRPLLDAIAAVKDKRDLARVLGGSLRSDVDALNNTNFHTPNLFGLWVAPDFNDSEHYT
ncbi:MAG: M13 family peptidase, partial [Acidobacteriales bacterium]|nr:M13 family peptidase [Terriglobales bacterium]